MFLFMTDFHCITLQHVFKIIQDVIKYTHIYIDLCILATCEKPKYQRVCVSMHWVLERLLIIE